MRFPEWSCNVAGRRDFSGARRTTKEFRSFIGGSIMDEEWENVGLAQSLGPHYFYFCVACFALFRAIITVLQHWPELTCWFHHRRHAKWLRETWRGP